MSSEAYSLKYEKLPNMKIHTSLIISKMCILPATRTTCFIYKVLTVFLIISYIGGRAIITLELSNPGLESRVLNWLLCLSILVSLLLYTFCHKTFILHWIFFLFSLHIVTFVKGNMVSPTKRMPNVSGLNTHRPLYLTFCFPRFEQSAQFCKNISLFPKTHFCFVLAISFSQTGNMLPFLFSCSEWHLIHLMCPNTYTPRFKR